MCFLQAAAFLCYEMDRVSVRVKNMCVQDFLGLTSCWLPTNIIRITSFNHMAFLDSPNVIGPYGSNSDKRKSRFGVFVTFT